MDRNLFDKKTFNQIRTDLIHIQADLMTTKEQLKKLGHIIDFVGPKMPKVASAQNHELALSVLNEYFKVSTPVVTRAPHKSNYTYINEALKSGQIPSQELLLQMEPKGGLVLIKEDYRDAFRVDRERISDLFGNILKAKSSQEQVVRKILEDQNIVRILGPQGLEEQIPYAFSHDPVSFLHIFEDLDLPLYSDQKNLTSILTALLERSLNKEPADISTLLNGFERQGLNRTLRVLLPYVVKKYPNYTDRFWSKFRGYKAPKSKEDENQVPPVKTEQPYDKSKKTKTYKKDKSKQYKSVETIKEFLKASGFGKRTLNNISSYYSKLPDAEKQEVNQLLKGILFYNAKRVSESGDLSKYKENMKSSASALLLEPFNINRSEIIEGLKNALGVDVK